MRFFTAEWIQGDLDGTEAESMPARYARHLEAIAAEVRYPARCLLTGPDMHDAIIHQCTRTSGDFTIAAVGGDRQMGYFEIDIHFRDVHPTSVLPALGRAQNVEVRYDEYDIFDRANGLVQYSFVTPRSKEYCIVFRNADFEVRGSTESEYLGLKRTLV